MIGVLNFIGTLLTFLVMCVCMTVLLMAILPVFVVQQVCRIILVFCELVLMGRFHAYLMWVVTRSHFAGRMTRGDR